jgi:hypothetical protein
MKKLLFQKSKKMFAFALLLMMTISAASIALPITNAHYPPWTIPTFAFLTVSPSPIGVGQQALVIMWIDKTSPDALNTQYGEFFGGYKLTITKPDGNKEVMGPYMSEATSTKFLVYTPNQVGVYKFVFDFPGQTIHGTNLWPGFNLTGYGPLYPIQAGRDPNYINDTYSASTSEPVYLNVQAEPIKNWAEPPVPNEFWTRPINAMNREWSKIAGNWLSGAAQNVGPTAPFGYGTGPESAHVMWTKPYFAGGLVGGENYGGLPFTPNRVDSSQLSPPIIIDGKLYYNINVYRPNIGWYCVDLVTGETLYFKNATTKSTFVTSPVLGVQSGSVTITGLLAWGSVLAFYHPDIACDVPYLWVTSTGITNQWDVLDAYTGERLYSIANVSSTGTAVYGNDGSIDRYNLVNLGNTTSPKYYLTLWNSTLATARYQQSIWYATPPPSVGGEIYDGRNGFTLNVSIPAVQGSILTVREGKFVIGGTPGYHFQDKVTLGNIWALSLKPGQEGQLLWNITFTPPENAEDEASYGATGTYNPGIAGWEGVGKGGSFIASSFFVDPEDNVFVLAEPLTQRRWGFDLTTGNQLWESKRESQWQYFSMYTTIYEGKLFSSGYGGQILAYDIKTGQILWNYNATAPGFESPYGDSRMPLIPPLCADGKLYVASSEHSPTYPLSRGRYVHCLDTNTGELLWKLAFHGGSYSAANTLSIGDGYLIGLNNYDEQIYCIGKGPSATTVTVQSDVISQGSSVLIKGTVTDTSAGTKQTQQAARFPNGVPAIADEDMDSWMEYLYEQQTKPNDAKGVAVVLSVKDPNNNTYVIGETTSDASGMYKLLWKPDLPGAYTVIATFAGSKSYWPSSAEAAIGVVQSSQSAAPSLMPTFTASPTITTPTLPSPSPATINPEGGSSVALYVGFAAVILIVAVVAIAIYLRRRK